MFAQRRTDDASWRLVAEPTELHSTFLPLRPPIAAQTSSAERPLAVAADINEKFTRLLKYRGDPEAEWASYASDARRECQEIKGICR